MKFAQTGDTHLRDAQYNRRSRGTDFYDSVIDMVRSCAGRGIKLIIHTGDFFDRNVLSTRVHQMAKGLEQELKTHGIAMLAITGNHDFTNPTWLRTMFPKASDYKQYGSSGLFCLDDDVAEFEGVRFQGLPYTPSGVFRSLEDAVFETGAEFLVLHQPIQELSGYPSDKDLKLEDLPHDVYKGILLGDIHKPGTFEGPTGCVVHYAGSTEVCSSSEPLDKYYTEWSYDGTVAKIEDRVPIRTRKYLRLSITDEESLAKACADIKSVADHYPVVRVEYPSSMEEVMRRVYACLDPDTSIVIPALVFEIDGKRVVVDSDGEDDEEVKTLRDFLEITDLPEDDKINLDKLGSLLCEPRAEWDSLVSDYVNKELERIKA